MITNGSDERTMLNTEASDLSASRVATNVPTIQSPTARSRSRQRIDAAREPPDQESQEQHAEGRHPREETDSRIQRDHVMCHPEDPKQRHHHDCRPDANWSDRAGSSGPAALVVSFFISLIATSVISAYLGRVAAKCRRQCASSMFGKSVRRWTPRDSVRSSAASTIKLATVSMFCNSQPVGSANCRTSAYRHQR